MTTHIHKTTLFPSTLLPSRAGTAADMHGFICDFCAGEWVYGTVSEAEAHAKQHERIPDGQPGPQPWTP